MIYIPRVQIFKVMGEGNINNAIEVSVKIRRTERNLHSGTSVLVGTAICNKTTLSRQTGFSSRNFSKANIFWGIPLIMSKRSTPNITCQYKSLKLHLYNRRLCVCSRMFKIYHSLNGLEGPSSMFKKQTVGNPGIKRVAYSQLG